MTSPTAALAALAADVRREGDLSSRSGQMGRLYDIADKLEALAALPESGWLPIESAPKDGTRILLVSTGGAVWLGHWRKADESPYGHPGWTRYNTCDIQWCPRYWQPLPAAPTPGEPT